MRFFTSATLCVIVSLSCAVRGQVDIATRSTKTHIVSPPLPSVHCPPICRPELLERSCVRGRCVEKRVICAEEEANFACPLEG
ncbi:hypothetical protein FB451DRAFT_1233761 [Mycena latifolia]|nr:hypothetical protein FB451DRAFT_1233761 [Mycena latifolia]